MYKRFFVSWSPRRGEATYSRSFGSEAERAEFIRVFIPDARSVHTWENEYRRA